MSIICCSNYGNHTIDDGVVATRIIRFYVPGTSVVTNFIFHFIVINHSRVNELINTGAYEFCASFAYLFLRNTFYLFITI